MKLDFIELEYHLISFSVLFSASDISEEFDSTHFWFSPGFKIIDWDKLMEEQTPFLNYELRGQLIDYASAESINPLIIITATMVKKRQNEIHSNDEASNFIKDFSSSLISNFSAYEDVDHINRPLRSEDVARSAVYKAFDNNRYGTALVNFVNFERLYQFLYFNEVRDKYNQYYDRFYSVYNPFFIPSGAYKWAEKQFSLTWPWPVGEYWYVGAPHPLITSVDIPNKFTSLDVWKPCKNCCDWKQNPDCKEDNTPIVTSMFNGLATSKTKCSITIIHDTGMGIEYHNLIPDKVSVGQDVRVGDPIGSYLGELVKDRECKQVFCRDCSHHIAHLRITLINKVGRPQSLKGWMINGYKVYTGGSGDNTIDCSKFYFQRNYRKFCPNDLIKHREKTGKIQFLYARYFIMKLKLNNANNDCQSS